MRRGKLITLIENGACTVMIGLMLTAFSSFPFFSNECGAATSEGMRPRFPKRI